MPESLINKAYYTSEIKDDSNDVKPEEKMPNYLRIEQSLLNLRNTVEKLELLVMEMNGDTLPEKQPKNEQKAMPSVKLVIITTPEIIDQIAERIENLTTDIQSIFY